MVNQYIAQNVTNPFLGNAGQASGANFFGRLIPNFFTLLFAVGSVVFVFVLIYGAIQWITSGGDANLIAAARGKVISAVVGLVILFSIFALLNLVECFFGVGIRHYQIGPLNLTPVGQAVCQTGGGGSNTVPPGYTPPPGYCVCGNNAGCTTTGMKGQRFFGNPQCYVCQNNGGWQQVPGDMSCTSVLNCGPCP